MRRRQHTNDSFDTLPPSASQYPTLSHAHPHHPHTHGHTHTPTPPLQIPQSTHPFPRSASPLSSSPTQGTHMHPHPAAMAPADSAPSQQGQPGPTGSSSKRGFFSRPRWFSRDKTSSLSSASGSPLSTSPSKQLPAPSPPRASFSLGFRRTTLSTSSSPSAPPLAPPHAPAMHPTASRSLLDVSSLPPVPGSPHPSPPRSRGSSHRAPTPPADYQHAPPLPGSGDLKSIATKPWSRSMDDFSRFLAGGKGKEKHPEREREQGHGAYRAESERQRDREREREREHDRDRDRKEREKITAYRERGLYAAPAPLGASVSTPLMLSPAATGPVTPPATTSPGPPRLATPQPISPLGSPGMLIPASPSSASPKRSMDYPQAPAGGDYISLPRARGPSPAVSPGSTSIHSSAPGSGSGSGAGPVPFPSSSEALPSASASTSSLHLPRLGNKGRSISESRVTTLSSLSGSPNRDRDRDRGRPSEDLPPVPPLPASVSSQPGGGGWFATSRSGQLTAGTFPAAALGREQPRGNSNTNREAVVPSGSWPTAPQGRNEMPPGIPPVPSIPQGIARAASPLKKASASEKEKEPELAPFLALLSPTVDSALAQYAAAARQRSMLFPSGSGGAGAGGSGSGMGLMPEEKGRGKGDWRVYKASLKGSKVLFYKVPNDRQPAVDAHFPRSLVAIDEQPSPPLQPPPGSAGPSPSAAKVRKRVYWGKGRHPDWRRSSGGMAEEAEEEGEDAWEGTGEAVAHECVFRSFVAEKKRDTLISLAGSLRAGGAQLQPEEIPLPEDGPEDFPDNPEPALEQQKQDAFVLSAMAVMPVLWGKEFWTEIDKRVETTEVGREREHAVSRLRGPMLKVWGKDMCESLEGDELVKPPPRPAAEYPISEAMEKKLRTGLDLSTFLSLSPESVARSLKVYHVRCFPVPFLPSSLLSVEMEPWMYSLAPEASEEPLHPLTRMVLLHVLVESRTREERRAAVKAWAEVLKAGPGYAAAEAIRRALGAAPLARLEGFADLLDGVVFGEDDGKGVWRGGRKQLRTLLEDVRKDEGRWGVKEIKAVWEVVEERWETWTREETVDVGSDGDVGALVQFWEEQAGETDVTYQTISSFLAPSLAAQPKLVTWVTEHFWAPRASYATSSFLLSPLQFPEGAFPTPPSEKEPELVRLMDGQLLVRLMPPDSTHPQQSATRPPSLALPSNFTIPSSPSASKADHRTSVITTLSRATTLSRRSSLPPPAPPVQRALLIGATLDRLADLLVVGEDIELDLPAVRDDLVVVGRKERVSVDVNDAKRVFWAWKKTWMTGLELFELLRKKFDSPTPSPALNWPRGLLASRVKYGVLQALEDWLTIGDGAQEAREDASLGRKFTEFLATNAEDADEIAQKRAITRRVWDKAMRTPAKSNEKPQRAVAYGEGALDAEAPDLNILRAEDLVDRLEDSAAALFADITRQDLLAVADLFEVQLADRLAFFQTRDAPVPIPEDVPIQNIMSFLTVTDAATALSPSSLSPLSQLLPDRVRRVLCGQLRMQTWLASKVAEPGLGPVARQQRVSMLLRAMDICRTRMSGAPSPTMRSFVEASIAAALLTPESRSFTRAWQGVGQIRGLPVDTLNGLLSSSPQAGLQGLSHTMTVDLSWILERIIELLATPNASTFGQEASPLINLKKRRCLNVLLADVFTAISPLRGPSHDPATDLTRLRNMEKESEDWPPRDMRPLKEEAWREQQQSMSLSKAQSRMRPFARTITMQIDKLKRDRQVRDRLTRDIRADKEKNEKKDTDSNRLSMQPKKPVKGGHKKGRSVTAFFRVVRPLSTVFGSEKQPEIDFGGKSLPELDFTATSKPALSLSLVHATARPLPNEVRSFTFAVETEDGGRYVLQAANPADREQWVAAIGRAAQISAARRSLMEANVPKMDLQNSDWEARPPSQHPKSVYGVTLATVLEREGNQMTERGVPLIISQLIEEVERRGLTETGIYRISGSKAAIENIRNSIDKGLPIEMVIDEYTDIYAICDAIKQWFRDLPESILPATLLKDFDEALKIEDYNTRMFRIQDLVVGLPRANFLCLRGLAEHLYKITDYEDQNQMHADNLATVWAPTLCRLPNATSIPIFQMFGVLGPATGIVKQCILQYHWIFNEQDEAEPESVADTELQTPTTETPAVEERRFSMTVTGEGAVVLQEETSDRRSEESKASSGMSMPNIDVTGPTPEPSVDSHGEYGREDEFQHAYYPNASTSTSTQYP
ncbi:hypothetical protein CALCODRAFT_480099 [Calocera cornea HHB12733]|uniref:Rho GTPase activation protein n=1 Tax=Calocera cornea HHB12733 TaxID=1353952 RepID=A0A165IYJ8_9BASI|nr:hypothetical protein CALCODRAFT_480099 [Calocera cornea HHB12733]